MTVFESSNGTPALPSDFTGLWINHDADGGRRELEFVGGKPHGRLRVILPNGVVQRECSLVKGQYHGEMTVRDAHGSILDVSSFDHGTGVYRIFMTGGQLGWEIHLRAGLRHGPRKRFDHRGGLLSVEQYVDDVLVSAE